MRRFLFMIFTTIPICLLGQSGSISVKSVDHNQYKNGETGLNIHFEVHVSGCKNHKTNVVAFFYKGDNGEDGILYGGINGYKTDSGQVCVWQDVTPGYDNTVWEDLTLFIPYSAIPHDSNSRLSFKGTVRDYYDSSEYDNSDWYNFHFNGSSNNQANINTNSYPCNACQGTGMYSNWNPVYGQMVTFTCTACFGTGKVNNPSGIPVPVGGVMPTTPVVPQVGGYVGGGNSGVKNSGGNTRPEIVYYTCPCRGSFNHNQSQHKCNNCKQFHLVGNTHRCRMR